MAQNNSTLYFLQYNNYYNRIIKREETLDNYLQYQVYQPLVCNFNPADGVQTDHILPLAGYIQDTPEADYLVVANEENQLVSRWFIIDANRIDSRQYQITLQRDLIADFYESVISAPSFIERAVCSTGSNLIFNSDNLHVNQIKKNETLLKDSTGCPWIVGYVASSFNEQSLINAGSDNIAKPEVSDYTYAEWQNFQTKGVRSINSITFNLLGKNVLGNGVFRFRFGSTQEYKKVGTIADYPNVNIEINPIYVGSNDGPKTLEKIQKLVEADSALIGQKAFEACQTYSTPVVMKKADIDIAMSSSGVLVRDSDNHTFTANLTTNGISLETYVLNSESIYTRLMNMLYDNGITSTKATNKHLLSMTVQYANYHATVKPYDKYTASALIKSDKVAHLQDAPYKMFCIPYPLEAGTGRINTSAGIINPQADIGMNTAMRIAIELTKENIYDLQLLPYCPATNFIDDDGIIDVTALEGDTVDKYYTPILSGTDELISYMLWCDHSSFSTVIQNPITTPSNNIDFKVEHETSFYRLNSPNYNGSFEFKATSNRGIDYFEVDCTYKPYSPYIHVAPNFKGLYGGDYNDARGLVCGGDFSLPTITDAWEQYQVQNKNYLNTFNRQVENMETTYKWQMEQYKEASGIGVISSALSTGASGAYAGATIGGGAGAAIGGIVGAATAAAASSYGRKKDIMYSKALHDEALSYTKDQFNLSLQNIQALPYTLNNVSAFNVNNKYFVFLEYFTCSDEEKEAYRLKLTYRSMPINICGTIEDFIQPEPTFVSAQVIRFTDLGDDYHVAASIASEIHQGIYI